MAGVGRGRGAAAVARGVLMGACYALTAALLAAAAAVDHFAHARMGMARHMVYLRSKWSEALPVEVLRVVAVVVVAALAVALAVWLVRSASWRSPLAAVACALAVVLACLYACYTLGVDPQQVRAHIAVSPLLGLAALVQEANAALACLARARRCERGAG